MTLEELQKALGGFTNKYGNLLSGIGGLLATEKGISEIKDTQAGLMKGLVGSPTLAGAFPQGLINSVQQGMQFKPFTVTSGTGATATADTLGGLNLNLAPQEQALQNQLLGVTGQLAGSIGSGRQQTLMDLLTGNVQNQQAREADIYGRLNAMQAPEQERARLQLEQRLANQGRLGVRTSMFGGTPEALALEKAIAEQQAGSAVSAMEQARAEQTLLSNQRAAALDQMLRENLGAIQAIPNLLQSAYTPQTGLINALSPSVDLSRIQSALQAGSTEAVSNLGMEGLTSQTNLESFIQDLRQRQLQGFFDLLANKNKKDDDPNTGTTNSTANTSASGFVAPGSLQDLQRKIDDAKAFLDSIQKGQVRTTPPLVSVPMPDALPRIGTVGGYFPRPLPDGRYQF